MKHVGFAFHQLASTESKIATLKKEPYCPYTAPIPTTMYSLSAPVGTFLHSFSQNTKSGRYDRKAVPLTIPTASSKHHHCHTEKADSTISKSKLIYMIDPRYHNTPLILDPDRYPALMEVGSARPPPPYLPIPRISLPRTCVDALLGTLPSLHALFYATFHF